ncbi:MAG: class I SAM-dependent methyltransferase [Thaumarchaeota archaeon]|nr:class I SAM-dependent methyltransferase [Nitrososphaerota archaeon]MCL5318542.1 class I SAM-dependent methyltransferase [Nitrososphaerota archaeon]
MSSSYLLDPYIINIVERGNSVLDVACGRGKWGHLVNTSHKPPSFIIGVDIWPQYLKETAKHRIYDDVILCDAKYLPLRDSSFDTVLACEVLEHVEKSEGKNLLKELERVCRDKIIVSTPKIRFEQDIVEGNAYQIHRSRWSPNELRKHGYLVRGVGFGLFGASTPPMLIMGLAPLSYYLPETSYILLAVKERRHLDSETPNEETVWK